MRDAANRSGAATAFMLGGLVTLGAALGFLGWRWMNHRAESEPAHHAAAPAPAATPSEPEQPVAPTPSSGERLSG